MADVLNALLSEHSDRSLDIATGYFNMGGFRLLQKGLEGLGSFRLLLGDEPDSSAFGEPYGSALERVKFDLEAATRAKETANAAKDLLDFLGRDRVAVRSFQDGFLHAKCYLFCGDSPGGGDTEGFQPLAAVVDSSNFTYAGMVTNKELNIT